MNALIRQAQPGDIPAMLALAEQKRQQYQTYQPVFWRAATDAQEKQRPYFEHLMTRENVIMLVYEFEEHCKGFIIATLVTSPPVYDAGGATCLIDDFYVPEHLWQTAGSQLLTEALQQARQRGAVQTVVVCGHLDQPKREMLAQSGFGVATEWYVQSLK
jgi:GNAT superfamily N-acetyltransferase